MTDAEKVQELQCAVAALLDSFITGEHYETKNPYIRPCVQKGLKALGRTAGYSTFGSDWADALDNWKRENQ